MGEASHAVVDEAKARRRLDLRRRDPAPAGEHRRHRRHVTDGPSPETKAVVGGFSIIEVPSREEALAWAAKIAVACRCAQEVREIMYDPES